MSELLVQQEIISGQRAAFDLPREVAYLNCAYMSPQLHRVTEAGQKAVLRKTMPWKVRPNDYFDGGEELRGLVGRLIGSDAEGVALAPSASYGLALAAANLDVQAGQNLIVLAEQFPSNVYVWREMARERGAHLRTVARPETGGWTEAVLDALDERTAVLALPNVHWTDGTLVDLEKIGAAARAVGAALVVAASQSLGAMPFSVDRVRPDFLVFVGYKWMLGPYGTAYLYAAPHRREGRPLEQSWLTRAGSEDFTRLVQYSDAYRAGARRYDVGQFNSLVQVPMNIAAVEQLLEWGVERISAGIARLTDAVAEGAQRLGCEVAPANQRSPHMIGVRLPCEMPEGLTERLASEQVHVSIRGQSIRVSPHLYNDMEDVDRLLDVLASYC